MPRQRKDSAMKLLRLLLILLLLPIAAGAEFTLEVSAPCLAVNSILDFTLSGSVAENVLYTMSLNGTELFTHETSMAKGSYIPRQSGQYMLTAQSGEEIAQASFTVTDALTLSIAEPPAAVKAGEPVFPRPQAAGGSGQYSYVYTITHPDGTQQAWQAGADWHWVAAVPGEYTLRITVRDTIGAAAETEIPFTVAEGPGISAKATGGALLAHGGQKSWQIFAPGSWTAATQDAFICIDTPAGASGGTLNITITEATQRARQGLVIISSDGKQLELPVTQSASHGIDEEITLGGSSPIHIDGTEHAAWLSAQGSRSFTVDGAPWQAETNAPFIHLEQSSNTLSLAVEAPETAARHGVVAIHGEGGSAYIHVHQPAAAADLPAAGAVQLTAEAGETFTLFSQSSGYWQDKPYGKSNLEQSGCAIFALSHVLQEMGFEGERITPEYLAANYSFALREGGTINATLVGNVGDDLGYKTRYELYKSLPTIQSKLREGAMFTFEVARGHIAAVVELSEDGSMCRIIDSAPSATFERITNASMYRQKADGSFTPITALTELENMRYYIETGAFSGAEYWLESSYVARRGVRLIQLP